jgi:pyruvate,orthophosphate dikinase
VNECAQAVAQGILTARGGMTSHAAVVARGMNVCCVAGCGDIEVNEKGKQMRIKATGQMYKEGDWISLDGEKGIVYHGESGRCAAARAAPLT